MKFITEEDLRDLYKKQPFTNYEIPPGERLTPGARQFLLDRGINMYDDSIPKPAERAFKKNEKAPPLQTEWKKKKFCSKVKSAEALFLLAGEELLTRDVGMAQNVLDLQRSLSGLKSAADGKCTAEGLTCKECSGINQENFSEDLDDCFMITQFHMQFEKSREILTLHRLRCVLHELQAEVTELYGQQEDLAAGAAIGRRLNQIINTLSQMICAAFGGKECQRNG